MERPFSDEVRAAIAEALAAGGFPSIEAAAWEVSLTVALSKVSYYERECEQFRRKYGKPLEAFRTSVEELRDSEDFAVEDDLADWEFADRALQLWQKRVEILRHAAA
ncbi:MAG: hypothetical protein ACREOH_16140 [Candidatus Entotheonellia bacterium]